MDQTRRAFLAATVGTVSLLAGCESMGEPSCDPDYRAEWVVNSTYPRVEINDTHDAGDGSFPASVYVDNFATCAIQSVSASFEIHTPDGESIAEDAASIGEIPSGETGSATVEFDVGDALDTYARNDRTWEDVMTVEIDVQY